MQDGRNFYGNVYDTVRKIPRGRVATYQQIAIAASTPRAARMVGWALRALPEGSDVPWQRVINSRGMISIQNLRAPKSLQARLLRKEGIEVRDKEGNYFVDLEKYLWRPHESTRAHSKVALRGIRIAESRVRFPVSPMIKN